MKITFLLPMISRTGGPRVTVEMANILIDRGYQVRLVVKRVPFSIRYLYQLILCRLSGGDFSHWGKSFKGRICYFNSLNTLPFAKDEIVIGIGTRIIEDLKKIKSKIIKVRFCHGFDSSNEELTRTVWSGAMHTIAVAKTLIPQLEKYSDEKVSAVIPNGIRKEQYFVEDHLIRDGIGMVYDTHPNKAPDVAKRLFLRISEHFPEIPLYIFSSCKRPSCIPAKCFWYYPSIAKARELYNRAKVWLIPSRMEGFGLPILEAMACGAVCISTSNYGGMELIKHGKNGYIVPIGDPDAFIPYINLILNNEQTRQSIVQEGFKTVNYFNWDRSADIMDEFLNKISNNSHF